MTHKKPTRKKSAAPSVSYFWTLESLDVGIELAYKEKAKNFQSWHRFTYHKPFVKLWDTFEASSLAQDVPERPPGHPLKSTLARR